MQLGRTLISVIIPVWNGAAYLAEAIASVQAQDYRPLELIVVDDGSTDGSAVLAEGVPGVRCCRQPHAGLGAALNRGVQEAHGDWLAFLDADDRWLGNKLSRQAALLLADPGLDMAFGLVEPFFSPEMERPRGGSAASELAVIPGYSKGAMLIRRASFLRVGYFATRWQVGDFIDWFARTQELGLRSSMLREVVLQRRLHPGNVGSGAAPARQDYVRILKSALDRRRGNADGGRE